MFRYCWSREDVKFDRKSEKQRTSAQKHNFYVCDDFDNVPRARKGLCSTNCYLYSVVRFSLCKISGNNIKNQTVPIQITIGCKLC